MTAADLRRLFMENWALKLISLLLSLSLWFYVTSKGRTEVSFTVPLELRNVPKGMAVVGDVPATVEIRVQGQERLLRDSSVAGKIAGMVDLSLARAGENTLRLSPDDIRRPSGISVVRMAPLDVIVRLERLVRRSVRLRPVIAGSPAAGLRITGMTIAPQKVTVEGPASAMEGLSVLSTLPINVSGIRDRLAVEPRIDYQGRPVKILERDISVTISVQKERS